MTDSIYNFGKKLVALFIINNQNGRFTKILEWANPKTLQYLKLRSVLKKQEKNKREQV